MSVKKIFNLALSDHSMLPGLFEVVILRFYKAYFTELWSWSYSGAKRQICMLLTGRRIQSRVRLL